MRGGGGGGGDSDCIKYLKMACNRKGMRGNKNLKKRASWVKVRGQEPPYELCTSF